MKLIYILILLFSFKALANESIASNFNYRPVVGMTYSNLDYDDGYKSDSEPRFDDSFETSFLLGLLIEFNYGNFIFGSGVQYASYKSEVSGETGSGVMAPLITKLDISHELNYLQVPLNISYYIREAGNGFHIQSGLIPSFLVEAKRSINSSEPNLIYNGPDLEDELKNFDLIASLGMGYSFKVYSYMYDISLNYHKGLIKVDDSSRNESATNSSFILQLSLSL